MPETEDHDMSETENHVMSETENHVMSETQEIEWICILLQNRRFKPGDCTEHAVRYHFENFKFPALTHIISTLSTYEPRMNRSPSFSEGDIPSIAWARAWIQFWGEPLQRRPEQTGVMSFTAWASALSDIVMVASSIACSLAEASEQRRFVPQRRMTYKKCTRLNPRRRTP
ncbi:hypothetical protein JMJ35_004936 [Cladonia borealis]|uniref:Uncharacterized protein n=1 Tax=Cladonia borealis TaxID=184061 RepID=A0AA39R336_9LECA|nr:hypothetical protein JMJ35_004936 [Cladonia borealis]